MIFEYNGDSEKSGIYVICNSHRKRYYIGQTSRFFNKRWSEYKYNLPKPIQRNKPNSVNQRLKRDFLKSFKSLGHDNFLFFKIIEVVVGKDRLDQQEIFHIADYRQKFGKKSVYNFLKGGNGFIEEIKGKIGETNKGKHFSVATEFKIGQTLEERFGSDKAIDVRKKLREAQLGKTLSEETKAKMSKTTTENNYLKGKTFIEVFGEERSNKLKQRISETTKLRPSNRFNMKHSIESIEKMKTAHIGLMTGMKNPCAKVYNLSSNPLVSPAGDVFTRIECLAEFCRNYELTPSAVCCVLNGKAKKHNGWKLQSNIEIINDRSECN